MNCSHIDEDHELVEKCKNGCSASFDALVNKYYPVVYSRANSFLNDPEEALDLTQEVFIDIYLALPSFRGDALFFTWLYQITTYKSKARLSYLIRKGHADSTKVVIEDDESDFVCMEACSDIEDVVLDGQRREIIEACLDKMPEIDRKLVVLRHAYDFSWAEISERLGLSRSAVKNGLARARYDLRCYIEEAIELGDLIDVMPNNHDQMKLTGTER